MSINIKDVELRIADPGVFTPRGNDYNEPITAWSARAVMGLIEPLERELGDFQNGVAACQRDIDRARSRAGHTEEAGEVCTYDCKGCCDPVGAIIEQMDEYQAEMFRRGREIVSTRARCSELMTATSAACDSEKRALSATLNAERASHRTALALRDQRIEELEILLASESQGRASTPQERQQYIRDVARIREEMGCSLPEIDRLPPNPEEENSGG